VNLRAATRDDLAAIAELFGSAEEAVTRRPSRIDATVVAGWLQTIASETNTWLVESEGTLVAGAFAQLHGERGVFAGAVRPVSCGGGLGTRLVELAEARLGEESAQRFHAWTVAGDTSADELFRSRGYREVRRFWDMAIELRADPPEPAVPVETFREEDVRAFHAADEEAFEDHWEYEPEPFEEWWKRQQGKVGHDPSLWFLIREGHEIAAIVRNELRDAEGYVGSLGVRRPWRGRGYGRALLLRSFREFRRRGMARATLGVDAANPTGATHLYESVGMHVEQEHVVWEKLRQ
jgi:mycothiol synthase